MFHFGVVLLGLREEPVALQRQEDWSGLARRKQETDQSVGIVGKSVDFFSLEDFAEQVGGRFEFVQVFGFDSFEAVHDFFLDDEAQLGSLFREFPFEDAARAQDVAEHTEVGHEDVLVIVIAISTQLSDNPDDSFEDFTKCLYVLAAVYVLRHNIQYDDFGRCQFRNFVKFGTAVVNQVHHESTLLF